MPTVGARVVEAREKCIDPDYRRDPNRELFCCRCQRSGASRYLRVYLRQDGHTAVHPDDVARSKRPDDIGWQPIGLDCAQIVGVDWCEPEIKFAHASGPNLIVDLGNGRGIAVAFDWYPKLAAATPADRARVAIIGGGSGVRWPDLDEDLSLAGMLEELRKRGLLAWER